ncbi:alpha/beta fold hydrolase [Carnobacterium gallinarum]|uniref:alpha/beta fold hydrolase n=1 Tax=Carnobacterium gallinarum TaxID=2749 RepID=UPI000557B410|nr:alpha/beta hydrolase [Carnobacterium gallinarum]
MKSVYIPVADAEIFCRIAGSGHPLVLLHGNNEDSRIFESQLAIFSQTYQVIAIDTRGHGHSSHGTATLSFTRIALDIVAVLDYLAIQHANFIGFSDGGNSAMYVAVKHPSYVDSLILVGANLTTGGMKKKPLFGVKLAYSLTNLLANVSSKYHQKKQIIDLMLKQLTLTIEDIKTIQAPTLVVAGENDMIEEAHTQLIADSIPQAELVIIPDADHFLIMKQPELFNQIALAFLAKLAN